MQNTTHTGGTWRFETNPGAFGYGHVVADVAGETHERLVCSPCWRDAEANACLIAAAPDLLAELVACVDMMNGALAHAPRIRDLLLSRIEAARAIIAKATVA